MFTMNAHEFQVFLSLSGLTSSNFAKLVDVTPRAVAMWISGERAVPGPAAAYVRVYSALPDHARSLELRRLDEGSAKMRGGVYALQFESTQGVGYAAIILDAGRIFGADPAGGKFDGRYDYDPATAMVKVRFKVTFPPNAPAFFAPAQQFEWSVDLSGFMDPRLDRGHTEFATPLGPKIYAHYQFLRDLP